MGRIRCCANMDRVCRGACPTQQLLDKRDAIFFAPQYFVIKIMQLYKFSGNSTVENLQSIKPVRNTCSSILKLYF